MSINEKQRRLVYDGLEDAFGDEFANLLMELLPYQSASSLVTRDDMHANTTMLRGEMAELRGEFRALEARVEAKIEAGFARVQVTTQRMFMAALVTNTIAVVAALGS